MLSRRDIICFSSIDWDFIWQGHQEIMQRLARAGNRVLFIENTGVRTPNVHDLPRLRQRWRNWRRGIRGIRKIEEGLYVYAPLILPFPYARWAVQINQRLVSVVLRPWMHIMSFQQPIAWVFLPTPLTLRLLRSIEPALTVYHCTDHFATSSAAAHKVLQAERQIAEPAELVFVTSAGLREHCAQWSSRIYEISGGVNLELFDAVRQQPTSPQDLEAVQRPRVGYVGGIHQWLDQALLRVVAQQYPHYSFVLVGPVQTDISQLATLANVHFLGPKSREEIPRYIHGFDVCVIPYRLTDYTRHVRPTKLNEYFALSKPVVSTALPEIQALTSRTQGGLLVAREPAEFAQHLQSLLNHGTRDGWHHLRAIAAENDWSRHVERMSQLVEEALARRWLEREVRWADRLRRFSRVGLRRLGRLAWAALIAYGLMFHTPLLWWMAAPLTSAQAPAAADAIVVFAGGVGESGTAGQGYEERVLQAVSLYQQGYASHLVFSSGYRYAIQEAEIMKALAVSLGIPQEAVTLEQLARNTYDNVHYCAALLRQAGQKSALVVSSPYHMRRVALVWRKGASDLAVRLTPVPNSRFFGNQGKVLLRHWQAILHEYLGIVYYWWKGWI